MSISQNEIENTEFKFPKRAFRRAGKTCFFASAPKKFPVETNLFELNENETSYSVRKQKMFSECACRLMQKKLTLYPGIRSPGKPDKIIVRDDRGDVIQEKNWGENYISRMFCDDDEKVLVSRCSDGEFAVWRISEHK